MGWESDRGKPVCADGYEVRTNVPHAVVRKFKEIEENMHARQNTHVH